MDKTTKKNEFDGSLLFGVKDFNKKTSRDDHIDEATSLQTDFFIDPATSELYEHMQENRSCPICENDLRSLVFKKDGFRHVKCNQCHFIYVNPTANDEYRDQFFSKKYESWTEVLLVPEQERVDKLKFIYGLDLIENNVEEKKKIVDIGAGSGLFLETAREKNWDVSGVEFNQKAVESIRSKDIEVFDQPLEDGIYEENSVQVVTLWEVLEHINHPSIFLKQVWNILDDSGLLLICVPNINALVTRLLHEKARTFGGSSHVNFFSINTLTQIVEKIGFKVIETDTMISELGTINNHLSYNDHYSGPGNGELDFLTPEFIYKHELGSRILLLAEKN